MPRYRIWVTSTGAAGEYPLPRCRPFGTMKSAEIHANWLQHRAHQQAPGTDVRFEVREMDIVTQATEIVQRVSEDSPRLLRAAETVASWYVADPMVERGLIVEQVGNVVWARIGGQRYTITVQTGP